MILVIRIKYCIFPFIPLLIHEALTLKLHNPVDCITIRVEDSSIALFLRR